MIIIWAIGCEESHQPGRAFDGFNSGDRVSAMIKRRILGLSLILGLLAAGCGEDSSSSGTAGTGGTGGAGGSGFEPPEFGAWVKYEPE
ncbi:MAG: hypothetical protein WBN30_06065, partial [Polyangiales bacterium]